MILIGEVILFCFGVYLLIVGKADYDKRYELRGWRARVVGLMLMAPIPVCLMLGLAAGIVIGAVSAARRQPPPSEADIRHYAALGEIVIFFVCFCAALVVRHVLRTPKARPAEPPADVLPVE